MRIPRLSVRPAALAGMFLLLPLALRAGDDAFDRWVDDLAAAWVRADPESATNAQYFTGAEQDALDRQLTPNTPEHRAARVARARAALEALAGFDRAKLDTAQRVSAAMLEWHLADTVAGEEFEDFRFPFQQFSGLHVRVVNFLSQTHPIRNRRDVENYLARLGQVAGKLDEGIAQAAERAGRGFLMPRFIYASALGQLERFLSSAPRDNVLVASLAERMEKLADLSAAERAAFREQAEMLVVDSIQPAFRRMQALLTEQMARSTDDAGVWRLPGGDRAYAQALRRSTTTALTPGEIHELGLKEVARIEGEMDGLLRQLGYTEGPVNLRYAKLNADSQPPAEPDPRPALLARYEEILADAVKRADLIFDLRPKAPCVVKREPPFTERTAAAHYTGPAADGTRPGIFWAPLPGPFFPVIGMKTLTYHEAIPGHHFQVALQGEMQELPRFRRDRVFGFISAYGEGWALYAEQLAAENNWYEGDIPGRLGQLQAELFRARRLVVDTGLHAKKWTRQQAIDYGIGASEVERYIVWPGQACSYKVGQLRILALRAKAREALGPKFDLKQFHNVVLRTGSVPLDVLERVIDDWVASVRG